jgi:protein-tyrosine-phosphatase
MDDSATRHWKVLFVCVGNCVRSQMAEAIARRDASDVIVPESAGLHPLGFIDKTAIAVLSERGISVAGQHSKGLRDQTLSKPDLVINMSGAPTASRTGQWKILSAKTWNSTAASAMISSGA